MKKKKKVLIAIRTGGITGWTTRLEVFSDGAVIVQTNKRKPLQKNLIPDELQFLVGLLDTKLMGLDSTYPRHGMDTFNYSIVYFPQEGRLKSVVANDNGRRMPEDVKTVIDAVEALING